MKCSSCGGDQLAVVETTKHETSVYRWRYCKLCFHRFKTKEDVFTGPIPQVRKPRLTTPKEKEVQKSYSSSQLQNIWKI
jgi:transcriptional regulator NrdR family protein